MSEHDAPAAAPQGAVPPRHRDRRSVSSERGRRRTPEQMPPRAGSDGLLILPPGFLRGSISGSDGPPAGRLPVRLSFYDEEPLALQAAAAAGEAAEDSPERRRSSNGSAAAYSVELILRRSSGANSEERRASTAFTDEDALVPPPEPHHMHDEEDEAGGLRRTIAILEYDGEDLPPSLSADGGPAPDGGGSGEHPAGPAVPRYDDDGGGGGGGGGEEGSGEEGGEEGWQQGAVAAADRLAAAREAGPPSPPPAAEERKEERREERKDAPRSSRSFVAERRTDLSGDPSGRDSASLQRGSSLPDYPEEDEELNRIVRFITYCELVLFFPGMEKTDEGVRKFYYIQSLAFVTLDQATDLVAIGLLIRENSTPIKATLFPYVWVGVLVFFYVARMYKIMFPEARLCAPHSWTSGGGKAFSAFSCADAGAGPAWRLLLVAYNLALLPLHLLLPIYLWLVPLFMFLWMLLGIVSSWLVFLVFLPLVSISAAWEVRKGCLANWNDLPLRLLDANGLALRQISRFFRSATGQTFEMLDLVLSDLGMLLFLFWDVWQNGYQNIGLFVRISAFFSILSLLVRWVSARNELSKAIHRYFGAQRRRERPQQRPAPMHEETAPMHEEKASAAAADAIV